MWRGTELKNGTQCSLLCEYWGQNASEISTIGFHHSYESRVALFLLDQQKTELGHNLVGLWVQFSRLTSLCGFVLLTDWRVCLSLNYIRHVFLFCFFSLAIVWLQAFSAVAFSFLWLLRRFSVSIKWKTPRLDSGVWFGCSSTPFSLWRLWLCLNCIRTISTAKHWTISLKTSLCVNRISWNFSEFTSVSSSRYTVTTVLPFLFTLLWYKRIFHSLHLHADSSSSENFLALTKCYQGFFSFWWVKRLVRLSTIFSILVEATN